MSLGVRFQKIFNEQKLKRKEFAAELKITESYLSNLLRGKRSIISESLASLIQEKFGYSMQWVLTGKGDMYKRADKSASLSPLHRKAIAQIESMNANELGAILSFMTFLEGIKPHSTDEDGPQQ